MLAFELPPNEMITLQYVSLSRQGDQAELQKDFLRQALAAIAPHSDFVDSDEESQTVQSFGVYVRCLQCAMQPGNPPLAITSVEPSRSFSRSSTSVSRYMVRVSTQKGSQQFWNIEVGQRKTSWYSTLLRNSLTDATRVNAKNFEIKSCFVGLNCPRTSLFETSKDCLKDLEKHFGKRINLAASQKFKNNKSDIYTDHIVHQTDVRSQSFVRAKYLSNNSSLSIRMNVKALRSGSFGDVIPVELNSTRGSTRSRRQIDARVTGEGEVEIVR